jgi:ADP-ribosylglycohydrolase
MRHRWYNSPPFDIGTTTTQALRWAGSKALADESPAMLCMRSSGTANQGSKANGALMRVTPLAVWGHAAPAHKLAVWAAQDARCASPAWARL